MAVVKFVPEAWVGYDSLTHQYYLTYRHPSGIQYTDVCFSEESAVQAVRFVHKLNGFKILHPDTLSYTDEMRDSF